MNILVLAKEVRQGPCAVSWDLQAAVGFDVAKVRKLGFPPVDGRCVLQAPHQCPHELTPSPLTGSVYRWIEYRLAGRRQVAGGWHRPSPIGATT